MERLEGVVDVIVLCLVSGSQRRMMDCLWLVIAALYIRGFAFLRCDEM
jgi:hypothetical protein